MAAIIPSGSNLKIILKGGSWSYYAIPPGPINWTISEYDYVNKILIIESTESDRSCDLMIEFYPTGQDDNLLIEYYENESDVPSRIKELFIYEDLPNDSIM